MKKHISLTMILAASLCGCGGMLTSDEAPTHVYWLEPTALQIGEATTGDLPDLLVVVNTVPGLDTDRILVRGPGARMNYYAGARWPDHLPEVMSALVRLSLESSGRFARVSNGSQIRGDEWLLELELREFFAVTTTAEGPPLVHVKLVGNLHCGSGNSAISAAETFAAQESKLSDIVSAFQSATNNALIALGRQTEAECFLKEPASDFIN